ncbi:MAG: element excision factor XisH family protein [Cyanobacteria bacterium P01_F01_bin.150]
MARDRFHNAVSQALERERWCITADPYEISVNDVYLAIRHPVYESFFQRRFITAVVDRYRLRLMTYDPSKEVIVK